MNARGAMELVVAGRLERRLDKDRILELYLNVAEWGPGLFGVEAAAREYFGRGAADLSLEEAAALAATLPHPLTSNPSRSPGQMRWRQALILQRIAPGAPARDDPLPPPELVPPPGLEPFPPLEASPPSPATGPGDPSGPGEAGTESAGDPGATPDAGAALDAEATPDTGRAPDHGTTPD